MSAHDAFSLSLCDCNWKTPSLAYTSNDVIFLSCLSATHTPSFKLNVCVCVCQIACFLLLPPSSAFSLPLFEIQSNTYCIQTWCARDKCHYRRVRAQKRSGNRNGVYVIWVGEREHICGNMEPISNTITHLSKESEKSYIEQHSERFCCCWVFLCVDMDLVFCFLSPVATIPRKMCVLRQIHLLNTS